MKGLYLGQNQSKENSTVKTLVLCIVVGLGIAACASFKLDQPQITVLGFAPVKSSGMKALFELQIRIANPNGIDLPVSGMSYELAINDTKLLQGVSSKIPTIPAYGSQDVTLSMEANLFSAPKLLFGLMNKPGEDIHYSLSTKIDLQGAWPSFRIVEQGVFPTNVPSNRSGNSI